MFPGAVSSFVLFSSILVVILYFIILIIDKSINGWFTFFFAAALSCISMIVIPDEYWDLYRHYGFLDEIRNSGLSITDFLLNNRMRIGGGEYKSLLFFNIIRYLIAMSGRYELLPFVMTLLTYSIWGYISHNWYASKCMNTRVFFYGLLLNMVLIPYLFIISGLRNTLASALVALAFYECRIKGKSVLYAIPLMAMACTTHMSSIYMIVIFLASYIGKAWLTVGFAVAFTQIVPLFAQALSTSQYEYIAKMAGSYITYFMTDKGGGVNMYLVADLFSIAPIALLTMKIKMTRSRVRLSKLRKETLDVIFTFVVFMLCDIGKNTLIVRTAYVLGILSVPIISTYLTRDTATRNNAESREKIILIFIAIGFVIVMRYTLPELILSEWNL